jgi:predicted nucleotidyltransferase
VSRPATADIELLLRELVGAGVRFIVVGGAAAVIHGAPITTQDLDIVPQQDDEGLEKLLGVLERMNTRFRPVRPERDLAPQLMHLRGTGQLNLITNFGPLDVLMRLHDARGYEELLPHSHEVNDGGLNFRVIDLDTLIEIKRDAGRARDALVLPMLIAIRDRR